MPDTDTVLKETTQGVMTITLNRPKANAFNLEMVAQLQIAFKEAARNEQVRCVLLTGNGSNFSAGQDVKDFLQPEQVSYRQHLLKTYNPLVIQMRRLEKPILASIQGAAAGAALGVALACDLRIASEETRFVVGFLGIGLAPDFSSISSPACAHRIGASRRVCFYKRADKRKPGPELGIGQSCGPSYGIEDTRHGMGNQTGSRTDPCYGVCQARFQPGRARQPGASPGL